MPSSQPKVPSSPTKKHYPILSKTKSGEISKKTKKPILNAKSPTQILRRPSGKKQNALLRGVQTIEKRTVSEFGEPVMSVAERMDIETTTVEPKEEPMDIETKPSTVKIVKKSASRKPDSKKAISGGISKKMRKGPLSIKSASKSPSKSPSTYPSTYPSASPSASSFTSSSTSALKPSLRSPSDPSPGRHLHRPNGKFAPLIRMIRIIGIQGVQRCCDFDKMDTDEDYEWNYPGFNGYLLEELNVKKRQFPEMELDKKALAAYHAGEVNEYGIA